MAALDWGFGEYEYTAEHLAPTARAVVDRASVRAGERVLDLGCGTGNAARIAVERGARVVGVDPAARLLEVARKQVPEAEFRAGDSAAIPLDDGEVDAAVSVFAVIFAADPIAAAAEMARVTAPSGRVALSAWIPSGPVLEVFRLLGETVQRETGAPAGPPPFPWHEHASLAELFGPHGFTVETTQHSVAFRAPSALAYVDQQIRTHPVMLAGLAALADPEPLRRAMTAVLAAANEDPGAFQVTSHYVISTATRG